MHTLSIFVLCFCWLLIVPLFFTFSAFTAEPLLSPFSYNSCVREGRLAPHLEVYKRGLQGSRLYTSECGASHPFFVQLYKKWQKQQLGGESSEHEQWLD